ncbi:MAG: S24/S26 family peptidase [Deltaproteobacteria bacterium]|nr:S24/S26 family peptidase [Deltaproteobacteria bacterium]
MSTPQNDRNDVWLDETKVFPELISHLLAEGHAVRFSAPGDSMYPTICDGDIITVAPVKTASVATGDIILYRHKSGVAAHRVVRITKNGRFHSGQVSPEPQTTDQSLQPCYILRGDAALVFDDPVLAAQVLGKVTLVERQGRHIDPYSLKATICFKARRIAARFKKSIRFQP